MGAAICDRCDHVLDPGLGEEDPPTDPGLSRERDTRIGNTVITDPGELRPSRRSAQVPSGGPQAERSNLAQDRWDDAIDSPALAATNDLLRETWDQFSAFPSRERVAIWAGLALFAVAALPWRTTQDAGSELGIFVGAWPAVLCGLGVVVSVFLRQTRLGELGAARARLAHLIMAWLAVGLCAYRIWTDTDRLVVKGIRGAAIRSVPAYGVYLATAAAVVLLICALLPAPRSDAD
jgi:hypothetical protein